MAQVSDAESIILGLLSFIHEGCYGYEIEKMLSGSRIHMLGPIAFSSIYHVLKKLEFKQMITCKIEYVPGKLPRKRYSISENGRFALSEKVMSSLSDSSRIFNPADHSLLFLPLLQKKQIEEALKSHVHMLQEMYAGYSIVAEELSRLPDLDFVTKHIELYQSLLVARIDWTKNLIHFVNGTSEEELASCTKWMAQVILHKHQMYHGRKDK